MLFKFIKYYMLIIKSLLKLKEQLFLNGLYKEVGVTPLALPLGFACWS